MAPGAKRPFGLTILTSATLPRPRCFPAANTISGIFAERNSATSPMRSVSAHTWEPWLRRRTGTARWRSRRCCRQSPAATNMSVMRPASRLYLLHLRRLSETGLRKPRFERAIGVIYRPETEPASHYFQAVLPDQFDEYVWFDETRAITPFDTKALEGLPDTYPFGL